MLVWRELRHNETEAAAAIHRRAVALIPGYDLSLHDAEEYRLFYREQVFDAGPIWGAFDNDALIGHVALQPGWIDHLYVDPDRYRQGVGHGLVAIAQRQQDDLQLWTFQANAAARRLYERCGFVVEETTDGSRNEEGLPDLRYRWRRC